MALVFLEGFEGYAGMGDMVLNNSGPCRYYVANAGSGLSGTTYRTTQVTAANSRSIYNSNTNLALIFTMPPATELIAGCGFLFNNVTGGVGMFCFGGTAITGQGICIGVNASRQIVVATPSSYGAPATVIGTGATVIPLTSWNYVEARVKLDSSVGECEVYLNGVLELNLTNIDTAAGGITSYDRMSINGVPNGTAGLYCDDFYVCDKTGTTNNTFLGPISVYSLMPAANGSTTQFTPVGVASNWDAVNDGTNDTTTYVSSTTAGQKDYYTFQALPGGVTSVQGVLLKARSALGASGVRKIKLNLKNGANVIASALKNLVFPTYLEDYLISDTAPDGTAWTPAKVNASEAGVEIT